MEANGLQQRVLTLEDEMRLQRSRSHDYGNKITEQGSQIEDAREDIKDLRDEMNTRFDKVDHRFEGLIGSMWRVAGFVVGAMGVAVAIVSVVIR